MTSLRTKEGHRSPFPSLRMAGDLNDPAFDRPLVVGRISDGIVETRDRATGKMVRHNFKLPPRKEPVTMTSEQIEERMETVAEFYNNTDMTLREIAEEVGVSIGTVKNDVRLAKAKHLITEVRGAANEPNPESFLPATCTPSTEEASSPKSAPAHARRSDPSSEIDWFDQGPDHPNAMRVGWDRSRRSLVIVPAEVDHGAIRQAVNTWGATAQLVIAIEEAAELIKAVSKVIRYNVDVSDTENLVIQQLAEECADVEIMSEQIRYMIGNEIVDRYRNQKLDRLEEKLEEVKRERVDVG